MLSSDISDHVVYKRADKHAAARKKWNTRKAGKLDLERTAGKSNVLTEEKALKKVTKPQWMINKEKRKQKMKARKAKNKAIMRQQKAYRKAIAQKMAKTSLGTKDGEEISNLSWLEFCQAESKIGTDNTLITELKSMTTSNYTADKFARKAGNAHTSSTAVWEETIDQGHSSVSVNDAELLESKYETDENGVKYAPLPELFHGFKHTLERVEGGDDDSAPGGNEGSDEKRGPQSQEQDGEDDVEVKDDDDRRRKRTTTTTTPVDTNFPEIGTPDKSATMRAARRERSESINPMPEFTDEESIANHHVDLAKLHSLTYTEQRHRREEKKEAMSNRAFDMTLPVKNMRVLKPQDFSIRYLSHCMVRDGRSPFFYHREYRPPVSCCLGKGEPRHTFETVPMLCKVADPTVHHNPTWGNWNVERLQVIRDFFSREEACMFAAENRITNIFPGAEIPRLQKKKVVAPHASNNALMKNVKKKKLTREEKRAAKLKAKKEVEDEKRRIAEDKAAKEAAEEAKAASGKAHKEVSLTINDYGVVKARTWHDDEIVLVLENGRVLGVTHKNPAWVPAAEFAPIEEMKGHYVLQASWARGKWRAINRNGESLLFAVPRPAKEGDEGEVEK